MTRLLPFVFALLLSLGLAGGALAREEIRNYITDIRVNADASLDVTETITVNAEGYDIRRGIYRDIQLGTTDGNGSWEANRFVLTKVLHNGQPSPYVTEWNGRFLRVYIGDADVFIPSGQHTYTINYITTRQLRSFAHYDELYWNVTGNFWGFPIMSAVARVQLPAGARAGQLAAYTGAFGEARGDFTAIGAGESEVRFDLTKPLGPEQGMTISVRFTKGVVKPVVGSTKLLGSGDSNTWEILK